MYDIHTILLLLIAADDVWGLFQNLKSYSCHKSHSKKAYCFYCVRKGGTGELVLVLGSIRDKKRVSSEPLELTDNVIEGGGAVVTVTRSFVSSTNSQSDDPHCMMLSHCTHPASLLCLLIIFSLCPFIPRFLPPVLLHPTAINPKAYPGHPRASACTTAHDKLIIQLVKTVEKQESETVSKYMALEHLQCTASRLLRTEYRYASVIQSTNYYIVTPLYTSSTRHVCYVTILNRLVQFNFHCFVFIVCE